MSTKSITIIIFSFIISSFALGQNNIRDQIDSLRYLKNQPFDCNSIYWKVVASGKEAIPILIEKLTDTTPTQIKLTCKSANVKLGDICYVALEEIFNFPIFYITKRQFDFYDEKGCRVGVLDHLDSHRQEYKEQIENYYLRFKSDLKYVKYDKSYKNICKEKNKISGYYDIDWKLLQ